MRIWVIKTGEPIPYLPEEAQDRFLRSGQMVRTLLAAGHDVTWWSARFYHQKKSMRAAPSDTLIPGTGNTPASDAVASPDIFLLNSLGYRRHIGPARLIDHAQLARGFARHAPTLARPGLIVASWPTIELADAAVRFGAQHGIPVVLDIRDLWPDIIYAKLNTILPFRTNGFLLRYERMGRRSFRGAHGVTGLSQGMIDWARDRFGGTGVDRVFHQSMTPPQLDDTTRSAARAWWRTKGVDLDAPKTRLVWSGSLVPETDGRTLLAALDALPPKVAREIEVILCGTGSLVPEIEALAARAPHVVYAGWVEADRLAALTEASHIGLLCYLDRFDFRNSVPNKVVDYCAGSMRILTNLGGEVPRLLDGTGTVIPYPTGDVAGLGAILTQIAIDAERYRVKHPPARAAFDAHFDTRRVLADYVTYVEELART
ncbi:glycosyltransferase [Roseovarius spongiae]|uniref:Glycosyltransferase n=1 Tax=Roseovarius spongiae TaxID=2320272 RepID=A0A3A8B754_9RHOB|nr:glycosyltransferase [Roseovarius spongiae]RKF12423.1 glycosyltransferase [Roseovarius spongiae]